MTMDEIGDAVRGAAVIKGNDWTRAKAASVR